MDYQVLVAYATKHGATAEIAEKIGATLREAGLLTDVLPAERVSDLTPYDAVIVGSAVYIGRWRKEAVKFLQNNEELLADRPVWLFSSGPTGEEDVEQLMSGWLIPKSVKAVVDKIQPRDIVVFHGELDMDKLNLLERWTIKNVKAPVGDFRDWESITAWAMSVAAELQEAAPAKTETHVTA